MNSAKEFFNNHELAKNKCEKLAEDIEKSLEWEKEKVSDYSPHIVEDNETVVRQIFSPIHIGDDNEVKTSAFDDVSNKGLSVNRGKFLDEDELHRLGKAQVERHNTLKPSADRGYIGYVSAITKEVREIIEGSTRVYAVYDTALQDAPYHADVCMLLHGGGEYQSKKVAKQARRRKLQRLFSNLKTEGSIKHLESTLDKVPGAKPDKEDKL